MSPVRPSARLGVVIAVALLLTGCGGSGVAPNRWAKAVCGALAPWRTQISALTGQVQQQMTGTTTPAQARQQLVALLTGAHDASETARRGVAAAGTPDVPDGARIANQFVASIAGARDAYGHARDTVSTLDTAKASAFYDRVTAAFQKLNSEYAVSALDTDKVESAELRKAFDEVPECR